MITDYQSNAYRISYQGVSMIENALENPNLIQVGVVPGCTIMVAPQKSYGIDYLPNGEYRSWTLTGYNTRLNRTEAHYIYARLERDSDDAMVLFSVNDYATDGSIGGENPSEDFYYIRIGSITATDSLEAATLDREITLDYGKLSTPAGNEQDAAGWKELFEVTADDLIRPLKRFTSYIVQGTLSIIGKLVINDKQISDVARQGDEGEFLQSDESVPTTKLLTGKYLDLLRQYLINKDREDSTKFLLTMMAGIVVGEKGFAEGLTGFGAKIDKKGYGEMRGLRLWEFLEVPELRYNRVEIFLGIKWRVPGAGIILSCTPDTDSEGNQLTTGTCTLKLEEGEFGAVSKDDIALGIFHFGDERDATEDSDDSKGNFKFSGFATSYFRVTEVSGDNNETFRYALRPGYTIHPQPQMNFSCYGNFTDDARQSSAYETRSYTRLLWKQNDWEFTVGNIAMQYGDLTNLNIFGLNMSGYSMYLNSVYFTGTINQVKPDGTPVLVANEKGAWKNDTHYDFYDRVSHKGCIWLCVNEEGTITEPSESNPNWLLEVSKGEAGQDGTSFRIIGSKEDESQLPQSGNEIGDAYLINGDLWVWTVESVWENVGNVQGPAGESVTSQGKWYTGLHVPNLGVVRMWTSTYMCQVPSGTDNPPAWCWTDKDGNRFIFTDGGYALTGELNGEEYMTIATDGKNGIDGIQGEQGIPGEKGEDGRTSYFHIKYSNKPDGNPMTETPSTYIGTYVDFEEQDSSDYKKYKWARFEGLQGEKGIPGENGENGLTYYLHIKYSNDGGSTFTGNNGEDTGDYIGVYTDTNEDDSSDPSKYKWSKTKGDGYTTLGKWHSDMVVPKLGVVTMAGSSFAAKIATTNPPLWCWTDNQGNRFIFSDGGYVMTGEENTSEYDMIASKGEDGTNAAYNEEIYTRTTTYSIPSTPTSPQRDEYVPSGWTRTQSGISSSYPYEWVSKRRKSSDGVWGLFSTPVVCAQLGEKGVDGLQGCAIRDSEWALNTEYRNDSDVKDGSLPVRYIDVALVRNNAMETGWDAYQCLKTHVSSSSITYANTQYWKKFGANVGSIFTSLIIAKNAKIQLFQGNDLLIQKDDGTVTAGMTGSNSGSLVRIFAGSTYENRASAPFRVTESGEMYATKAHIQGEVVATSGSFSGELKAATGTFTGSILSNSSGKRILINPDTRSIQLILPDNNVISEWAFFELKGYQSCNLKLFNNGGENLILYPHIMQIRRGSNVQLNAEPDALTLVNGSNSISIRANQITMSDGNIYTGYTGSVTVMVSSIKTITLYFKNGICYKIG